MIYDLKDPIDWDSLLFTIKVKDLANKAEAVFEALAYPEQESNNIYVFRSQHENLFVYTTDAFNYNNGPTKDSHLSLLLMSEANNRVYYIHHGVSSGWKPMEAPTEPWLHVLQNLMLNAKFEELLAETQL